MAEQPSEEVLTGCQLLAGLGGWISAPHIVFDALRQLLHLFSRIGDLLRRPIKLDRERVKSMSRLTISHLSRGRIRCRQTPHPPRLLPHLYGASVRKMRRSRDSLFIVGAFEVDAPADVTLIVENVEPVVRHGPRPHASNSNLPLRIRLRDGAGGLGQDTGGCWLRAATTNPWLAVPPPAPRPASNVAALITLSQHESSLGAHDERRARA